MQTNKLIEAYRYELSNNFYFFFKESWHVLEPVKKLRTNWHHKLICDLLQRETVRIANNEPKTKDIIINLPFRSTKSTIVSQMWNAWAWIKYPSLRFVTSSYAARLSLRDAKKTRDIITSKWYQSLFSGSFKLSSDQNIKSEFENNKMGKRFSASTDSSVTGDGGDILIWDDANSPRNVSFTKLNSTTSWYDDVYYSRLDDHNVGIRVGIQQRIHEEDLTGHIIKKFKEDINHFVLPVEISDNINPPELKKFYKNGFFWEWKFNKKELENYKKVLSATGYSGQLEQRPSPAEGNKIKKDWLEIVNEVPNFPADMYIDGAYTKNTKNDPTGLMTSIFYKNILYITNFYEAYLEMPELLSFVPNFALANNVTYSSIVKVEPKASGKSLVQLLKNTKVNATEITGNHINEGKEARVNACTPTIQAGKVKILKGEWNKKFIDQLTVFPNGKHDEAIDTLCYNIYDRYVWHEFYAIL